MLSGPTLRSDIFLYFSDTQYPRFVQMNLLYQINQRLQSDQLLIQLVKVDLLEMDHHLNLQLPLALLPDRQYKALQ